MSQNQSNLSDSDSQDENLENSQHNQDNINEDILPIWVIIQ